MRKTLAGNIKCVTFCSAEYFRSYDSPLFLMSCTHIFYVQDSVEALLFLRGRRIHRGWFSQAARTLHLGEEHWKPGEDPAWNQRRAAAGCRCKDVKNEIVEIKTFSTHFCGYVYGYIETPCFLQSYNLPISPLTYVQWHPVRPIIASISSGVVSIWAQNQVVSRQ